MNLKLFFIGMLFFVNPNVNIIDIVPDFIGLFLMFYSLRKLRDLSCDIEKTRTAVLKLTLVNFLKQFSLAWTFFSSSEAGFLLVFTFCFTIAESVYFISIMSSFCNGVLFLGTMYNGTVTLKHLNSIKNVSIALFLTREILTLAPELLYLRIDEFFGYLVADYKGGIVLLCVVLQFISGIIWVAFIIQYISIINQDKVFSENLTEKYERKRPSLENLFKVRKLKHIMYVFGTAVFLTTTFFLDGINFIPDYLSAIAFIAMIILLKKYIKNIIIPILLSSFYLVSSAGYEIVNSIFAKKYYYFGISKNFESYEMYITTIILSAVKTLFLIVLAVAIYKIINSLINDHIGIESKHPDVYNSGIAKHERHTMRVKSAIILILMILAACSSVIQTIFLNYQLFPYWIVDLFLHLLSFAYTVSFISNFNAQLETKYL